MTILIILLIVSALILVNLGMVLVLLILFEEIIDMWQGRKWKK